MTCPECGATVTVTDDVISYHTRPDNLAACTAASTPVEDKPKARKPRTKK